MSSCHDPFMDLVLSRALSGSFIHPRADIFNRVRT